MTYGTLIKQSRETKRLTQEQLAEHLDVTRQAVSKWEANLSRPTREKLDKLSLLLDIPPETWAQIDAENAPTAPNPYAARPWKIATAVLAAVCAALAIALAVALRPSPEPPDMEKNFPVEVNSPEDDSDEPPTPVFPDALPLFTRRDYTFGDWALGEYDPAEIPDLDDGEQIMKNETWCDWFSDGTRLSLLRVPSQWSEIHFNMYLLYAPPAETTDGNLDCHILFRIGEDYTGDSDGMPETAAFTNVLGYDGFKITISAAGDLYRNSYYISQLPDGKPCMVTSTGEYGHEADVDDDGALEIVSFDRYLPGWEITDTVKGEEGAFVYTLDYADLHIPDGFGFEFNPERGGFLYFDNNNTVISRLVLREGQMARIPATDFSVSGYPDAAGTDITFVTDYQQSQTLSDGLDPDVILPYNPKVRITHRQQAYIALQELFNMTGIRLDSCYCAASEFGVYFSHLPDGFNERGFFSAHFGESYGGSGIPGFYISWRELGNDWSPLSFAEALPPEGNDTNEKIRWYYERMRFFNTGEVESMSCLDLEPGAERRGYVGDGGFYLTNGSLYTVNYLPVDGNTVLTALHGPYPDGRADH